MLQVVARDTSRAFYQADMLPFLWVRCFYVDEFIKVAFGIHRQYTINDSILGAWAWTVKLPASPRLNHWISWNWQTLVIVNPSPCLITVSEAIMNINHHCSWIIYIVFNSYSWLTLLIITIINSYCVGAIAFTNHDHGLLLPTLQACLVTYQGAMGSRLVRTQLRRYQRGQSSG